MTPPIPPDVDWHCAGREGERERAREGEWVSVCAGTKAHSEPECERTHHALAHANTSPASPVTYACTYLRLIAAWKEGRARESSPAAVGPPAPPRLIPPHSRRLAIHVDVEHRLATSSAKRRLQSDSEALECRGLRFTIIAARAPRVSEGWRSLVSVESRKGT